METIVGIILLTIIVLGFAGMFVSALFTDWWAELLTQHEKKDSQITIEVKSQTSS